MKVVAQNAGAIMPNNISAASLPCEFTVADAIAGPSNACKFMGLSPLDAAYTIEASHADGYDWSVSSPATMVILEGQGTGTIRIHFTSSFTVGTIEVVVTSKCSAPVSRSLSISKTAPLLSSGIRGPSNACPFMDGDPVIYSIDAIDNAYEYLWVMPGAGAQIKSGQGTTSIQVLFRSGFTAGSIKVKALSGCATSAFKSLPVAASPPARPSAIYGDSYVCPYVNADSVNYFWIKPVPGATYYNWTVPIGAMIVSHGQSTLGTPGSNLETSDTMIGVKFNSWIANATKVTCASGNNCGLNSSRATIAVRIEHAAAPGKIDGPFANNTLVANNVCPLMVGTNNASGTPVEFRIAKVRYAASYNWIVPRGVRILYHSGTGVNDTAITVKFEEDFQPGNIIVQSRTGCGIGGSSVFSVKKALPSVPGTITGETNPCPGLGTPVTYSIAELPENATSVLWIAPAGAYILGSVTDLSVQVIFTPAVQTGALIKVAGVNNCAVSAFKTLKINKVLPGPLVGIASSVQSTCPSRVISYSLATMPANATSIQWTVPAGGIIKSGQGTLSITVYYPGNQVSGTVMARGVNACAGGPIRSLSVNLPACVVQRDANAGSDLVQKPLKVDLENDSQQVIVFPNPSSSGFRIKIATPLKEKLVVNIYDLTGRLIQVSGLIAGEDFIFGDKLKAGIYIVELWDGRHRYRQSVVKL